MRLEPVLRTVYRWLRRLSGPVTILAALVGTLCAVWSVDIARDAYDLSVEVRPQQPTTVRLFDAGAFEHIVSDNDALLDCQPSGIVDRQDAYRCFTSESMIIDPCFTHELVRGWVICPDPWTDEARSYRSTPEFQVPEEDKSEWGTPTATNSAAWKLDLEDGWRCIIAGGASTMVGNVAVLYTCRNGEDSGAVLDFPDRTTEAWSVLFSDENAGSDFQERTVRIAWF